VLAAFRKQQVSNSVIDSGSLTHCESCSHCVGRIISNLSSSNSATIDSGLLTHCGGCSLCVGGNISKQSLCSKSVTIDSGLLTLWRVVHFV